MALVVWLGLVRSRLPGAHLGHGFVVKSVQVGIRVAGVELNVHFSPMIKFALDEHATPSIYISREALPSCVDHQFDRNHNR